MSWRATPDARVEGEPSPPVVAVLEARRRTIGNLPVRRLLPTSRVPTAGPFVYMDHMGPHDVAPGQGFDVPQHPHIHLSTVTYLFEGAITHRDSTPATQVVRPGAVNWMTAGRGATHSERVDPRLQPDGTRVHGVQLWAGLPQADEECEPSFQHYPADAFPDVEGEGSVVRVLVGSFGRTASPVRTPSRTLLCDLRLEQGAELEVEASDPQRAVYVASGRLSVGGASYGAGRMAVLAEGARVRVRALEATVAVLLGGAPLDGPRHIWWNFVSSRPERVEEAARAWAAGRFPPVPDDKRDALRMPPLDFPWRRPPRSGGYGGRVRRA